MSFSKGDSIVTTAEISVKASLGGTWEVPSGTKGMVTECHSDGTYTLNLLWNGSREAKRVPASKFKKR